MVCLSTPHADNFSVLPSRALHSLGFSSSEYFSIY